MISHILKIVSLHTETVDAKDKFVVKVDWKLSATKDDGKSASFDGCSIWSEPGEAFTPFEQLTEEQVKSWIEFCEPLDAHRLSLEQQMNWSNEPATSQTQPLPWEGAQA